MNRLLDSRQECCACSEPISSGEILVCKRCHQEKHSAYCRHCGMGTGTDWFCDGCGPTELADQAVIIGMIKAAQAARGEVPCWPPRLSLAELEQLREFNVHFDNALRFGSRDPEAIARVLTFGNR